LANIIEVSTGGRGEGKSFRGRLVSSNSWKKALLKKKKGFRKKVEL